jgi:hypothetical protein
MLGIVQGALNAVDNLARGQIGGARRRGGHEQRDDFLPHALNHSAGMDAVRIGECSGRYL